MPTYAQFRAFHAIAVDRSFRQAAERLRLTQPAVSIQIRNLERDSATALFRRNGHAVDLTEEGRALFDATRRMFDAESLAHKILLGDVPEVGRTVHLGADGPHAALDLIAVVSAAQPDVRFRVAMANAEETWESLMSLKVDAVVMANAKPDRRVASREISRQDLVALVPLDHELSGRGSAGLEHVAKSPLIFRERGSNTQRIVAEALSFQNIEVRPVLEMGSREAVIEAVARGLGVGFVLSNELGQDPRYASVRVEGLEHCNTDMLLALKDQRSNPLVRVLFEAAETLSG